MSVIFKGEVDYCLNDYLNHWLTSFVVVILSDNTHCNHGENTHCNHGNNTFCLQLWANEAHYQERTPDPGVFELEEEAGVVKCPYLLFETRFSLKGCVAGVRKLNCFMRDSFNVKESGTSARTLWFLSTADVTINLSGENAPYLLHQIQYKRCEPQAEVHNYELDKVFYVTTAIGEVDVDETEFLLAVTPSDISLISLFRRCITRSWPITGIRKFGIVNDTTLKLELGKKVQFGDRTHAFHSPDDATSILQSIRRQINLILMVIKRKDDTSGPGDEELTKRRSESSRASSTDSREEGAAVWRTQSWSPPGTLHSPPSSLTQQPLLHSSHSPDYRFKYMQNIGELDVTGGTVCRAGVQTPSDQFQNLVYESTELHVGQEQQLQAYENSVHYFSGEEVAVPVAFSRQEVAVPGPCYDIISSFSSTSDTGCSPGYPGYEPDIYPDTELPYERVEYDEEVLYEKISFEKESAVTYQDVDLNNYKKKSFRRRSKYKLAPTFISYIEGGLQALQDKEHKYRMSNIDSSGDYNVLYDPKLVPGTIEPAKEIIYDTLNR